MMNFIFSNLNVIVLAIWFIFLILVAIRFLKPEWVKNISYFKLILVAVLLNILYGAFVTWGQYYVWANGSELTKVILKLPLPKDVPLPGILEWTRFLFNGPSGYFTFYIIGRVWLNIFITFVVSTVLYVLFKFWKKYRGGFLDYGPEILFILILASPFPRMLVSVSLGFIISVILSVVRLIKKGDKETKIELSFIVATMISLIFSNIILSHVL